MELRLVEIYYPESVSEELQKIINNYQNLDIRSQKLPDNWLLTRALLPEDETEKFTDDLSQRFAGTPGFRILILGVAATLPRPELAEKTPENTQASPGPNTTAKTERISREELYASISKAVELSKNFIVLLALSSVVAALGLLQGNLAVIIGAMVIAPLLGPNMALALATTLGDTGLARRALKTSGAALLIVLSLSVLLGFILKVDPSVPEVASRTEVNLGDLLIALASGSAGALAFTTSIPTALVGVMVSVALHPPLVVFGMLLGSLLWQPATGALLLVLTNIVAVNLAAVGTFIFQGIRPATWWEAEKAKKATRISIVLWIVLLAILLALILFSQHNLDFVKIFK
jgi:uncharacterized hydrophobic protein (TIGR00341 family)